MDRPQHSDLVRALKELSWSDVKRMAIHLDKLDLALLTNIEERPIEERDMYTMKAWLDRDREASWAKVVSALRVIGKDVLARKIDEDRLINVPSLRGQTESGPPVVSPVELQPSPGPDALHHLQPDNEAAVITSVTQLEPAFDHSASVSQDSDSDGTRAQEPTKREASDCPTVTQLKNELEWRRRQMISHVAIMAAIVGAALAAAESEDDVISLIIAFTGSIAVIVALGVNFFIFIGVPTELKKLAVFAAGAAVVVAVLVAAGTARTTAITTARTAANASRATVATASDSVTAADRSVMLLPIAGIIIALVIAASAVCIAEAVLPVLFAVVAVGVVTIGAGAGVMVAAAVVSATAAIMVVAEAGAVTARRPSQRAAARAAAVAVPALSVAVVTAAVGAPILKTAAVGLAAVVAVAAAATVAVGSFPAVRLAAVVTVATVVVAEITAVVISIISLIAVEVGPPSSVAAVAAIAIIAAVALQLASKLSYNNYLW